MVRYARSLLGPAAICAFGAALALGLAVAQPARAVLVYERSGDRADYPYHSHVFAARDDGTASRRIARGYWPQVSHDGRRIAYFVPRGEVDNLYSVGVHGRHRQLLVRDVSWPGGIAWSADDRRLVVGSAYSDGIFLVNVRRGTQHLIRTGEFGGASFAPDGETLAVESVPQRGASWLTAVDLLSRHRRYLGEGYGQVWGPPGLAFARDANAEFDPNDPGYPEPPPPDTTVFLRKSFGGEVRTLLHEQADLTPVDWSTNGHRLLVAEVSHTGGHALILRLKAKTLKWIPQRLSTIADLSRDGRQVLGESGGDVVGVTWAGTTEVLARDATHPSWTK